MFVLCPHCHFLVGMDPRTGGPPAACPKCGGTVVEPVAAKSPEAAPLDPFAQAALPSVAPTLPPVEPEADATPAPAEAPVPAARTTRPVDAADAAPASATTGSTKPAAKAAASAPPDPAMADTGSAPASTTAPAATGETAVTGKAPARPSADEMIAALATRPARKPRAPRARTRKPAAAAEAAGPGAEAEADTTPPSAASAPAAAATFGARLRRLFARAPRQADAAKPAEATPSVAPEAPAVADPMPTTPPLSIRNRRRRPTPKAPEVAAGDDVVAPVPLPADAPAEPMPMPAAAARSEEAAPAPGQSIDEAAGADTASDPAASSDAPLAPPENIDAAAAALVAAMPAPVTPTESAPPPARPAPSFARTAPAAAGARRDHRAVAAALALAGLLGLQLLLAQRAVLAADPGWRPTITAVCTVLRCTLPPWREPAAFTMLSRHVRPHPDAPGTLLIDASFRNDARWPQPWPRLELTLADVDGRTVGTRSFEAREYLGAAPTQGELAPGQAASLSLAVVEPAPDIVSFTFDFR